MIKGSDISLAMHDIYREALKATFFVVVTFFLTRFFSTDSANDYLIIHERNTLIETVNALRNEFTRERTRLNKKNEELNSVISDLLTKDSTKNADLQKSLLENEKLTEENSRQEEENKNLSLQNQSLKAESGKLIEKIQTVENESRLSQIEKEYAQNQITKLQKQKLALEEDLEVHKLKSLEEKKKANAELHDNNSEDENPIALSQPRQESRAVPQRQNFIESVPSSKLYSPSGYYRGRHHDGFGPK